MVGSWLLADLHGERAERRYNHTRHLLPRELLTQKRPRQQRDLEQHRVVDDGRLDCCQCLQRAILQRVG